jgi:ubiquinone/menaquinone biosynthesis C-methylase UbiE
VADSHNLSLFKDQQFNLIICVLALQNMDNLSAVFKEVRRVLKTSGKFVFVINHPTFRILKRSSWGWDNEAKIQYRRIDGYLSGGKIDVDMSPSQAGQNASQKSKNKTISYHYSLQDIFKALNSAGLKVSRLEEWISHKKSEAGTRQKAEDLARKEIPLFMAIEAA